MCWLERTGITVESNCDFGKGKGIKLGYLGNWIGIRPLGVASRTWRVMGVVVVVRGSREEYSNSQVVYAFKMIDGINCCQLEY